MTPATGPVSVARRMLHGWSLRRRVAVTMAVVLVVAVGVAVWSSYDAYTARATVLHDQLTLLPAQAGMEQLLSSMVDQETGERGYVLTANPAFLQPFDSGLHEVNVVYGALLGELAAEPGDVAELHVIKARYRAWLTTFAEPQIVDVEHGQRTRAIAAEASGSGKRAFDRLRAALSSLTTGVEGQQAAANHQLDRTLTDVFATAIARAGAIFVLLAGALVLLRRWVHDPVEQLAAEARQVAGGDLDHPIEPSGPPELRNLGFDVEQMRRRLRDEDDEVRRLRQALAEHSPLHLLLQSELTSTGDGRRVGIAGRLVPAEGVLAGDWFDAWDLGGDRAAVAVVDIAGHGPAAGFFALKIKHLLAPALHAGLDPGAALAWTSAECTGATEQFATGVLLYLDLAEGTCHYANAGHPPGLLFRSGGLEELGPTGPLLCAFDGEWRTESVHLLPGDRLVLTTDGVLEARLPGGEEFGTDRLVEAVRACGPAVAPGEVADAIVDAVRQARGAPLSDDATVVVIQAAPR